MRGRTQPTQHTAHARRLSVTARQRFHSFVRILVDLAAGDTRVVAGQFHIRLGFAVDHHHAADGKIGDGSQTTESNIGIDVIDIGANKAFVGVQEMPTFAGGEEALFSYLQLNTTYPSASKDLKIMGKVFVQFVVAPDGSIQKVIIARGVKGGKELEAEALRVVKNMPKWAPGKQNGVPVFVQLTLPVNFVLR